MLWGMTAALSAALVFGFAAIAQAQAARSVPAAATLDLQLVAGLLQRPVFYVAVGLNLAGFVLHFVSLRLLPLYLAQATISASLAFTALLAVRVFADRLNRTEWLAVGAVVVGLALLSTSAGETGEAVTDHAITTGLFVSALAVAAAGVLIGRFSGHTLAPVLGFLAGLCFAGSSLSVRLIPDLGPLAILQNPASYVLCLCGGLGFTLYSLALQRGAVTNVTAPMIVMQTLTPALVGIVLLGDAVRTGWWPAALLGLVVTGAGAATLGRFETLHQAPER